MMRLANGNLLFGLVTVGAGLFFLSSAWNAEGNPDDMIFPQVILGLIVCFGILFIIAELKHVFTEKFSCTGFTLSTKSIAALLFALTYPLAAFELGFYLTTLIFLTLVPLFFIRRDPQEGQSMFFSSQLMRLFTTACAVTAGLYLSFDIILKISMPSGLAF